MQSTNVNPNVADQIHGQIDRWVKYYRKSLKPAAYLSPENRQKVYELMKDGDENEALYKLVELLDASARKPRT